MTAYSLHQLEARLYKVETVTTTEKETERDGVVGMYVFRNEAGQKFMWSPRPERHQFLKVEAVCDADHLQFLCPACYTKNGGAKGTHHVMVTFAGRTVPEGAGSIDANGQPSRWTVVRGTTIDDLVLTPSILLDASAPPDRGCHWHGFVGSSGIPPGYAG